jgi:hypothetical protein
MFRRAVDEHPARFELIINLTTAKAVGITVPPALLALADEMLYRYCRPVRFGPMLTIKRERLKRRRSSRNSSEPSTFGTAIGRFEKSFAILRSADIRSEERE